MKVGRVWVISRVGMKSKFALGLDILLQLELNL